MATQLIQKTTLFFISIFVFYISIKKVIEIALNERAVFIKNSEYLNETRIVVKSSEKTAIVIVISEKSNMDEYKLALDTVECYCKIHNYNLILAVDTGYGCMHKDMFFRRHCVVAKILPSYNLVLFLDADVGIINPKRKIEEFLEDEIDVTFVNRFFNWEVAAGYYLVRNTTFAVDLLNVSEFSCFADYEFKLPPKTFGTDNAALQIFLSEILLHDASLEIDLCRRSYYNSKDFLDIFTFEACIKSLFGVGTRFGKVRIMKKGTGWVRDGWLTSMFWNPELDFMLHGWKMQKLINTPKETNRINQTMPWEWYNPFSGPINLGRCNPQNSTWNYDQRLIVDKEVIQENLKVYENKVILEQIKSFSRMNSLLSGQESAVERSMKRLKNYLFW